MAARRIIADWLLHIRDGMDVISLLRSASSSQDVRRAWGLCGIAGNVNLFRVFPLLTDRAPRRSRRRYSPPVVTSCHEFLCINVATAEKRSVNRYAITAAILLRVL